MAERTHHPEETDAEQAKAPEATGPSGKAMQVEESAPEHAIMKDALGNDPQPADQPNKQPMVKMFGEHEALVGDPQETGPGGIGIASVGEIAGGNITKLLAPPPSTEMLNKPMAKEQAAMKTKIGQQIAGLIARPVTEWGIIGPGDVIHGHMLLLDLNSGQKVRASDGHRVNEGELYMNLRNVPEALATGDTIDQVLGG